MHLHLMILSIYNLESSNLLYVVWIEDDVSAFWTKHNWLQQLLAEWLPVPNKNWNLIMSIIHCWHTWKEYKKKIDNYTRKYDKSRKSEYYKKSIKIKYKHVTAYFHKYYESIFSKFKIFREEKLLFYHYRCCIALTVYWLLS